ncbi:MAG: hypothetical protein R3310_15245 [Candidatus Competibacteraceae bacterium]|nr:hypothetical protein [Candidatus Competibacteraceae bacterium]
MDQPEDLRRRVAKLAEAHHQSLSPVIGLEEHWRRAELEGAHLPERERAFFWQVARTLEYRPDAPDAQELADWTIRFGARHVVGRWDDAPAVAYVAAQRFRSPGREVTVLPEGVDPSRVN